MPKTQEEVKQEIQVIISGLEISAQNELLNFANYLAEKQRKTYADHWLEVAKRPVDAEPLSAEEQTQLEDESGYVDGKEAKREFNLKVDLP